ncbi:MAG: aminoacyl-tRNA hydrolase, partial [Clostridia bacterium]
MKLIVGLGNPEEEYDKTRHNMGFHVINLIAERYEISMNRKKMDAIYGKGKIEGEEVLLLKPQTYMNLSGKSI